MASAVVPVLLVWIGFQEQQSNHLLYLVNISSSEIGIILLSALIKAPIQNDIEPQLVS